jgi:2-keto-4-pentenoate hydratase
VNERLKLIAARLWQAAQDGEAIAPVREAIAQAAVDAPLRNVLLDLVGGRQ